MEKKYLQGYEDLTEPELEDFENKEPIFEVWLCGMNETEDDYDYNMDDHLLATYNNIDEARAYAEAVYDDPSEVVGQLDSETKVFSIEVETVIQTAEDCFENVDTTYKRLIEIKK